MLDDLKIRLRALFRGPTVEREMNDELRFHLERQTEKYMAAGMMREEAARRARIELGGLEQTREVCREARGTRLLESLAQDVRYAVRQLRRSPAFTAVAILSLALGIGANTAIFSLLYGLAIRDLPVPHPEQLVRVAAQSEDDPQSGLSLPMYQEIARQQSVFSTMFAWWGDAVLSVEVNGALSRADVWAVSGNYLSELGAVPELGRLIGPEDVDLKAAAPEQVAVLSHRFWQRQFAGARDVVGQTVRIEGLPFTVIGVTREDFRGFEAEDITDVTVPLTAEPLVNGHSDVQRFLARRDALWLEAAGRRKPGVQLSQARAQINAFWPGIRLEMIAPEMTEAQRTYLLGLHMKIESGSRGGSILRGRFTTPLQILLAISGLVVLVACANLASLMLARAAARSHELGVRIALGAGRARIFGQMMTESITISACGTLAGFAFAYWGSRALAAFIIGQIYIVPAELNLSPDLRILGFAAASAILTGALFGLAPAWRAWHEDPVATLQHNVRSIASGTRRMGKILIVTQVALSVVLLAGAGLFMRSLAKLHAVEPGFRTRGVLVVNLFPLPGGYKNLHWVDYSKQITDRVRSLPGVVSAGMIHMQPASMFRWREQTRESGTQAPAVAADFNMVMPGALETLGIQVLRGRGFNWQDDEHAPHVALVSRSFAEKFFPGSDPIGKRLDITSEPKWRSVEIVGIVSDASLYDIRDSRPPALYAAKLQYADEYSGWSEMLVQTERSAAELQDGLKKAFESFGHEYILSVRPVGEHIDQFLLRERVIAVLAAFFGGLALLLAAIGLYGLMAYSVTQRAREIGIRMALGATRGVVRAMVLRETLALAGVGLAAGIPAAIVASNLIAGLLYGVSGRDEVTLAGVSLVLATVAGIAGLLPARRAMRLDPMTALRRE